MKPAPQGLTGADRAFAVAIASETLRWMVDIDALIDSATAQILPDDVKSRTVLRIARSRSCSSSKALRTRWWRPHCRSLRADRGGWTARSCRARSRTNGGYPTAPPCPCPPPNDGPSNGASRWLSKLLRRVDHATTNRPQPSPPNPAQRNGPTRYRSPPSPPPAARASRRGNAGLQRGQLVDSGSGESARAPAWVRRRSYCARFVRRARRQDDAAGGRRLEEVVAVDSSAKRLERLSANMARTELAADIVRTADIRSWAPAAPVDAVLLDALFGHRHLPPSPRRAAPDRAAPDRRDGGAANRIARPRRAGQTRRHPDLRHLFARARRRRRSEPSLENHASWRVRSGARGRTARRHCARYERFVRTCPAS